MAVVHFAGIELFEKDYHLLHDFFDFFCGKHLGSGESREVYEFRGNESLVIKINKSIGVTETNSATFDNVMEMDAYHNIKHHHPSIAKFLAEPLRISSCGRVMLQVRTTPIDENKKQKMPLKIPAVLADTKLQNWGTINGKLVCHDFANLHLFKMMSTKLIIPKWWSASYRSFKLTN